MIAGAEAPRIGRALESVASLARAIIVVLNAEVADGTEEEVWQCRSGFPVSGANGGA